MKLFQVSNKNNNRILIVAKNEKRAIELALERKFAKDAKNIKLKDVTLDYHNSHHKRGYVIPKKEGQLAQKGDMNYCEWIVF